jgi:hypothetical protein
MPKSVNKEEKMMILQNKKYIDDKKDEFCFINGINLIRIPYWDFDSIEQIITSKLHLEK